MSAPSPRPSAFLAIGNYLLCELDVGLGTFTMNVVKYDWLSVTGCFGQSHVSGNYTVENLSAKKTPEVGGNLTRECCPIIVHGQDDSLNGQTRIERATDSHQSVQYFGNAFQRKVLALNRHQNRIA